MRRERERERKRADLEFSSWFSVGLQTCLFDDCVFTGLRLVWDLFSELTPKWRPQLPTVFTLCSLAYLPLRVRLPTNFLTRVVPYFSLVSERGYIRFWWFYTGAEDLVPFLVMFLITVVIHPWLANPQRDSMSTFSSNPSPSPPSLSHFPEM